MPARVRQVGRALMRLMSWFVRVFCHPVVQLWLDTVLPTVEEAVKSFCREAISYVIRALNGTSAAFIILFVDKDYYRKIKDKFSRTHAWEHYESHKTPSTFNALIDQVAKTAEPATTGQSPVPPILSPEASPAAAGASTLEPISGGSSASAWLWWRGKPVTKPPRDEPPEPEANSTPGKGMKRSGSELFNLKPNQNGPALPGLDTGIPEGSGLAEDFRTAVELYITASFNLIRRVVRYMWALPKPEPETYSAKQAAFKRQRRALHDFSGQPGLGGSRAFTRSKSTSMLELRGEKISTTSLTASDVLHATGYPSEKHTVTTDDGYVLEMERIPRHGARDVAFFMHGILDTPLGWVASGVTSSIAFAAYDQGFDVWLASCRSNPPRRHTDPKMESTSYWSYSINELGENDIGAQVDHIHVVKCAELGAASSIQPEDFGCLDPGLRRSSLERRQGLSTRTERYNNRPCSSPLGTTSAPTRSGSLDGDVHMGRSVSLGPSQTLLGSGSLPGGVQLSRVASTVSMQGGPFWGEEVCERSNLGAEAIQELPLSSPLVSRELPDMPVRRVQPMAPGPGLRQRKGSRNIGSPLASQSIPRRVSPPEGEAPEEAEKLGPAGEPYRMRAVAHSLGGAMVLIHAVRRAMQGRPHHFSRLILLTPAGFHQKSPLIARPFLLLNPLWTWLLNRSLRYGTGLYVPTSLLRALMTKLMVDLQAIPALGELTRMFIRLCMSGDSSQWDRALTLPHYNPKHMPAVSAHTVMHLFQLMDSGRFRMYDYGSAAANLAVYGSPRPVDIAANYHHLSIPVDLMAGEQDGVISPENVHRHLHAFKAANNAKVTLKDFNSGHLDFTFSLTDDLRSYILSRMRKP